MQLALVTASQVVEAVAVEAGKEAPHHRLVAVAAARMVPAPKEHMEWQVVVEEKLNTFTAPGTQVAVVHMAGEVLTVIPLTTYRIPVRREPMDKAQRWVTVAGIMESVGTLRLVDTLESVHTLELEDMLVPEDILAAADILALAGILVLVDILASVGTLALADTPVLADTLVLVGILELLGIKPAMEVTAVIHKDTAGMAQAIAERDPPLHTAHLVKVRAVAAAAGSKDMEEATVPIPRDTVVMRQANLAMGADNLPPVAVVAHLVALLARRRGTVVRALALRQVLGLREAARKPVRAVALAQRLAAAAVVVVVRRHLDRMEAEVVSKGSALEFPLQSGPELALALVPVLGRVLGRVPARVLVSVGEELQLLALLWRPLQVDTFMVPLAALEVKPPCSMPPPLQAKSP